MQNTGKSKALMATALKLAEAAAEPALAAFRLPIDVTNKDESSFDPVTEADKGAEAVMRAIIEQQHPEDGILGEEMGEKPGTTGRRWIFDPIDGTRSFLAGTPTWMTLIGMEDNGIPAIGVAAQPWTGETFCGDGNSAYFMRNGQRTTLKTTDETSLGRVLAGSTGQYLYERNGENGQLNKMSAAVQHVRFDADAYFYCMVAAGQLGICMDTGLNAHDILPLIPIIEGAGGIVTTWEGNSPNSGGNIIASGNSSLHEQALAVLTQ